MKWGIIVLVHKGTVTLETNRLILCRFKPDDAEDMFFNWLSDGEVAKYLSWVPHETVEVTRQILSEWIKAYEKLDTYNWCIIPKEYGKAIGHISIVELSDKNQRCSIGYCMGKAFWNKGFMTEAFNVVMKFLFYEVGINRVQAKHDTDNPASGRVMEKVGMKYEGTLHQYRKRKDGTFGNSNFYALTKDMIEK
jgi:ribosomal-protein-alanine N-acetyltransferase